MVAPSTRMVSCASGAGDTWVTSATGASFRRRHSGETFSKNDAAARQSHGIAFLR